MDPTQDSFLRQYKWHIVVICVVVIPVVALSTSPIFSQETGGTSMSPTMMFLGTVLGLVAVLVLIWRISSIIDTLKENSTKLEEVAQALIKITEGLSEISQSSRLSESTKAIAFRDTERESLKEAVLRKLDQLDFESADELIDEIAQHHEHGDLATDLRKIAELKQKASRHDRIEEYIQQIDALLAEYQWSKASVRIEGLIKAYPNSDQALSLRGHLHTCKEEHKRELLSAWDETVKREDTDKGLKILKELDAYLTPNEALALQEAAKDVFRNKLHILGVQFSMAVSDKDWNAALGVGEQIIEEFPNSRMAGEINTKMEVLKQNVQYHVVSNQ
jgi:tetratricopeptide (TPR) repeat protein